MVEPPAATSGAGATPVGRAPAVPAWALALGGLRAAGMLLTRLPLGTGPVPRQALPWAPAFIPAIGLWLGMLGAILLRVLVPLGPRLGAAVAVGLMLLITGALHEDGLADTADALGGARDRAHLHAILKDSRLGTYGVLALCLSLLVRIETLAELGAAGPPAFALAAVLSRTPMVWLMDALPYVTPPDQARSSDIVRVNGPAVAAATILNLLVAGLAGAWHVFSWRQIALALATSAAVALLAGWRFHRRAGGITGDFLGATQQAGEIAILLVLLVGA